MVTGLQRINASLHSHCSTVKCCSPTSVVWFHVNPLLTTWTKPELFHAKTPF